MKSCHIVIFFFNSKFTIRLSDNLLEFLYDSVYLLLWYNFFLSVTVLEKKSKIYVITSKLN